MIELKHFWSLLLVVLYYLIIKCLFCISPSARSRNRQINRVPTLME